MHSQVFRVHLGLSAKSDLQQGRPDIGITIY